MVALRASPWPRDAVGLDDTHASRDEKVFQTECAGGHGIASPHTVEKAWNTVVVDIGTDRRTFNNSQL